MNTTQKQNTAKQSAQRTAKRTEAKQSAEQKQSEAQTMKALDVLKAEAQKCTEADMLKVLKMSKEQYENTFTDIDISSEVSKYYILMCAEVQKALTDEHYIALFQTQYDSRRSQKVDYLRIVCADATHRSVLQVKHDSANRFHINTTADSKLREQYAERFEALNYTFRKCYRRSCTYENVVDTVKQTLALLKDINFIK